MLTGITVSPMGTAESEARVTEGEAVAYDINGAFLATFFLLSAAHENLARLPRDLASRHDCIDASLGLWDQYALVSRPT